MNFIDGKSMSISTVGDGVADATEVLQQELDRGGEIRIPCGNYRITRTLLVSANTAIIADAGARFILCGETPHRRGDFLLSNRELQKGDRNIAIYGGIWDGNNQGKYNTKNPDLFAADAYSGAVLNFFNVSGLKLHDMVIANSVTFNIRMCRICDFEIRNIGFQSDRPGFNQDGLHFGGFVKNGIIENIRAITRGQTTDDMLALNADDCMTRLENLDLLRGPIENLSFKNIFADDCYTGIRMLSVDAPIRNIRFENLTFGCRTYAINMDAARYCRTPLFRNEDYPDGVGRIENVEIVGMNTWRTGGELPLLAIESNVRNFSITKFNRDFSKETAECGPTLCARNLRAGSWLQADDELLQLKNSADTIQLQRSFSDLKIESPIQ